MKPLAPVTVFIGGGILGLVIALVFTTRVINPTWDEFVQLIVIMGGTTLFNISVVWFVYKQRFTLGLFRLRWTLIGIALLTLCIILINLGVTAWLMFISAHDFALTTAVLMLSGIHSQHAVNFIAVKWLKRVDTLSSAARHIAHGRFETRVAVTGYDEIAELARTFNDMAATLQAMDDEKHRLEQTRRDLIAWVSHDLRAPLSAARAMNEALLDGVVTDSETVTRYQVNINKEIQNLTHLIDDLFELAQLDTGALKIERQTISIRDLISDTLGSMQAQAQIRGITLTGEVAEHLPMVEIAPEKIQRVLYNLLQNALHHTPANGTIHLQAAYLNDMLEISVHNTGSYIAPHDLPHIFTSFYRSEPARGANSAGYRGAGLGLAIARGLVEAHGGTLRVETSPTNGTTFKFNLPLAQAA